MQQSTSAARRHSKMKKVQQQFENWRKNRKGRSPIPESLWEAAVGLYGEYRIGEISKTLRLEGRKLKKRILNAAERKPAPSPTFIELDMPGLQPRGAEWAIEMENADGAKMKISGNGLEMPDFALICQNFLGRNR